MGKICLVLVATLLFKGFCSYAQKNEPLKSLAQLFPGIDLKSPPESWVYQIESQGDWSFDSIGKRGRYYSLLKNRKHFPFPDSVKVRILINRVVRPMYAGGKPTDTTNLIFIEGIFGNTKASEKDSKVFFTGLKRLLAPHYKRERWVRAEHEQLLFRGERWNFPDVTIECDYSADLKFYYVLVAFLWSNWDFGST